MNNRYKDREKISFLQGFNDDKSIKICEKYHNDIVLCEKSKNIYKNGISYTPIYEVNSNGNIILDDHKISLSIDNYGFLNINKSPIIPRYFYIGCEIPKLTLNENSLNHYTIEINDDIIYYKDIDDLLNNTTTNIDSKYKYCLTINSLEKDNTITIKKNENTSDNIIISYKTEDNNKFTRIEIENENFNNNISINLNKGERLYINALKNIHITSTKNFKVSGNLNSIDESSEYYFNGSNLSGLFKGAKVVDASDLILHKTLTEGCYQSMFEGCRLLENAPKLPAINLIDSCYTYMFSGCTSLTTAPELPATTLAKSCYAYMFSSCTLLTTAPELPVIKLTEGCYTGMFIGCTSLSSAPILSATTLVTNCYKEMFYGCSNLNYIEALFKNTIINSNEVELDGTNLPLYTANWVEGVSGTGTFIKNDNWEILNDNKLIKNGIIGEHGIPKNWVDENKNDYSKNFYKQYLTIELTTEDQPVTLQWPNNNVNQITYFNTYNNLANLYYSYDATTWNNINTNNINKIILNKDHNKVYLKGNNKSYEQLSLGDYSNVIECKYKINKNTGVIICKYNVTNTNNELKLLNNNSSSFNSMIIDGIEQESVTNSHKFDTIGEHTVEFTLVNGVTAIGMNTFKNCTMLTSITIPNSVTFIGNWAFERCSSLTSIRCEATVAPSLDMYDQNATCFQNISQNGTLYVPAGSTGYDVWMGTGDYYLGKYNWTKVEHNENNETSNLINKIKICKYTFNKNNETFNLKNFIDEIKIQRETYYINYEIDNIVNDYFYYSSNENVEEYTVKFILKDDCKTIPDEMFKDCIGLNSIIIPNAIKSMGDNVFNGCYNLTSITCDSYIAPEIGNLTFNGININGTLNVPSIWDIDNIQDNVPDFIDFGLPSRTLWATKNLGAKNITDYGYYYQWASKAEDYFKGDNFTQAQYNRTPAKDLDTDITPGGIYDTATSFNKNYQMPTYNDFNELNNKLNYSINNDGIRYYNNNGKELCFPLSGIVYENEINVVGNTVRYWMSEISSIEGYAKCTYSGYNNSNSYWHNINSKNTRYTGMPIRPVMRRTNDVNIYLWKKIFEEKHWTITESGTINNNKGAFKVYGNIMSLFYEDNFDNKTEFPSDSSYNLCNFFNNTNISDISDLVSSATTLTEGCYKHIFKDCTSLINVSENWIEENQLESNNARASRLNLYTDEPDNDNENENNITKLNTVLKYHNYNVITNDQSLYILMPIEWENYLLMYFNNYEEWGNIFNIENINIIKQNIILQDNCKYNLYKTLFNCNNINIVNKYLNYVSVLDEDDYIPLELDDESGNNSNKNYLTIECISEEPVVLQWPAEVQTNTNSKQTLEYSFNKISWISISATKINTITLNKNYKIYFKGENDNYYNLQFSDIIADGQSIKGTFNISGNIMSLFYKDDFEDKIEFPENSSFNLYGFFSGTNVIDASNLILPATTLTNGCYMSMFESCTSLVNIPTILPATTLTDDCYSNMFEGCTSLTNVPKNLLPATTLADSCYNCMFSGCSSLENAPLLPAETLAENCYFGMFGDCTALITAPKLSATILVNNCYKEMFNGCKNLNYIKTLFITEIREENENNTFIYPYTENWVKGVSETGTFYMSTNASWDPEQNKGVNSIPEGWIVELDYANEYVVIESLEDDNVIKFGMTDPNEYNQQFYKTIEYSTDHTNWDSAVSINYEEQNWRTTLATLHKGDRLLLRGTENSYTTGIVSKIYASKKYNVYGNIMSLFYGDNFAGQTAFPVQYNANQLQEFFADTPLVDASNLILSVTTLSNSCYYRMFKNCTELTAAPALPATTLISFCYSSMFEGCTSLTTAPELPATTLAIQCYAYMFMRCTSLVNPPTLAVTTLKDGCYKYMFAYCSSLVTAPTLPATTLVTQCYDHMLFECKNLNEINADFLTTPSGDYMNDWVYRVAGSGTFYMNTNASWDPEQNKGFDGIPEGWTVETYNE